MVPADASTIQTFKSGLQDCFKAAVDAGFTSIHITPHIDPHEHTPDGKGLWRNVVKFDPSTRYGPDQGTAFSYEDVLLKPVAEALNNVVNNKITVEMAMSAESGLSVWSYPRAYAGLMQRTKARITKAKHVGAGVSFNYDKVSAKMLGGRQHPFMHNMGRHKMRSGTDCWCTL